MKRSPWFWPSLVVLLGVVGGGTAAIIPAIVPVAAPSTSRRGTTTPASGAGIFQLAANTTAGSAGAAVCDDGNGNTTTSGCTANAVTSTSPVTVNTNTTGDQQLMELSLSAGYLNSLGRPFSFFGAGVYTTQLAQTPTLTFKIKLCTVSGCGSGTVVTLVNILTTAAVASITNNNWNVTATAVTATAGATGNLEIHGPAVVDLGATTATADSVFSDTNTAVSGNIDLTAALFVDFTIAFSTNAATANTCTQREGVVSPGGSTSGGGGAVTVTPPYLLTGGNNYGPNWQLTIPPLTGWTQVNNTGGTFDTTSGYPYLHTVNLSAVQTSGISRTAPSTPYSVILVILHNIGGGPTTGCGNCGWMLGWSDGTKISAMSTDTAGALEILGTHWNSATSFSGNAFSSNTATNLETFEQQTLFYKLCDDGTTLRWFFSIDGGNHFLASYTEAETAWLTNSSQLYFGTLNNGGGGELAIVSFKTTAACP